MENEYDHGEMVKQFAEEGNGIKVPNDCISIPKAEALFLLRMQVSEAIELAQTVCYTPQEAVELVEHAIRCHDSSPRPPFFSKKKSENGLSQFIHQEIDDLIRFQASCWIKLAKSVSHDAMQAEKHVLEAMKTDIHYDYKRPTDILEIIKEQADALIDSWYYGLHIMCKYGLHTLLSGTKISEMHETLEIGPRGLNQTFTFALHDFDLARQQMLAIVDSWVYGFGRCLQHGINLHPFFKEVHAANMNKRFNDGTFHKRPEDGKIIKPPNWKEPDLIKIVKEQMKQI
jgi:hypothetical protein